MISARPSTPRERQSGGDGLGDDHEIGLDVEVLHREHPPGASEAGLHLVSDEDDPVLVADATEPGDELGGGGNEAALALLGGSTTIAAICSGETCVRNSRSSAASAVAVSGPR